MRARRRVLALSQEGAFQACARFGLGARDDEIRVASADPRGWLRAQLDTASVPHSLARRHGGDELVAAVIAAARGGRQDKAADTRRRLVEVFVRESGARFSAQVASKQPFVERLALFWSNHFTVSVRNKPLLGGIANAFEVEAIRPHLEGRFEDMLLAVVRHPAMLIYLDNAQSFGPNSVVGRRRGRGLNENLAREILELHTLGVGGGYTQDDVLALAAILTGWTLDRRLLGQRVAFAFEPRAHEPGAKQLLGHRFAETGETQGRDALLMLARHRATARHVAMRLARHFVSDQPDAALVERLAAVFHDSGGDLRSVNRALVDEPAAWSEPLAKLKNPYEYVVSACRATGVEPAPRQVVVALEALSFRPFGADSPAGFPDTAADWAAPDALLKRIEWAHALAQRLPARSDPVALAGRVIGPVMTTRTRQTIERAASATDGIALLLASPEFQRR